MLHLQKYLTLLPILYSQTNARSTLSTSLVFAPWDARLSVITADATATTYLGNWSGTICDVEAYDRATIVNGPSTAGITYVFTACGTLPAIIYNVDCPLSEANTATCMYTVSSEGSLHTSTVTQNSSELSGQPATITAGLEKLNLTASTTLGGSASAPGTSSAPTATSTSSVGQGSSLTSLATTSAATGSQSGTEQSLASTSSSTSTSTGAAGSEPAAPFGLLLIGLAGGVFAWL